MAKAESMRMAKSRFLILNGILFSSSVDRSRVNFDHFITALCDEAEKNEKNWSCGEGLESFFLKKNVNCTSFGNG